MDDVYERLARFLDELPAGYPRTESGVEMRILRKLFTPEEAQLCLHLSLIGETAEVVAFRANQPLEQVSRLLAEMERKGLIHGRHRPGKPAEYTALHFVVGFWEGQVNRLDRELVEAFEEYLPNYVDLEVWRKAPQLRTIPVRESIPLQAEVLPYERAEQLIRDRRSIAVANCICRQEMRILGQGCQKPLETCLSFDSAADSVVRNGRGQFISQEEALRVLDLAEQAGLVLQPNNAQDPVFICACCGCCCGVLRSLKRHPQPASLAATAFVARYDPAVCSGCGDCLERCQMGAIALDDGVAVVDQAHCIGCGLCVSACTTGSLSLARRPVQPAIPKDMVATNLQLGQARGKLGKRELAHMLARSKEDRVKAQETGGRG